MTSAMRRGACPSLSAPMATGDGLLVRLNPRNGALRPDQLAGVAQAALRYGNGLLEITSRGSMQIRGLHAETVMPFTNAVAELGIRSDEGIEIRTGALSGCDALEAADPLPVAAAVRTGLSDRGLSGRLAPKVSVVVDGGGALGLGGLPADMRLEALGGVGQALWRLHAAAGNGHEVVLLDRVEAQRAVEGCLDCLATLADAGQAARARDLQWQALHSTAEGLLSEVSPPVTSDPVLPIGEFALRGGALARGFALPFGQISATDLAAFAHDLDQEKELRLAPARGLLVLGLTPVESERLVETARRHGLVTKADDPRLRIVACAGAPACNSAHLPTKEIAAAIVSQQPALLPEGAMLHLSGCSKKCARPVGPALELVGSQSGWSVEEHGIQVDSSKLRALARIVERYASGKRRFA